MSAAWWGQEAGPGAAAQLGADGGPELLAAARAAVLAAMRARAASFTPEWSKLRPGDAGFALLRLFAEQMEPVLQRLNRLPHKALVETLAMAGVTPLAATPAQAWVEFEVAPAASQSVLIPEGFQLGARAAAGGGLVVFETAASLYGAPAKIAEMHVQLSTATLALAPGADPETSRFLPFGDQPGPGRALLIGLAGAALPGPTLSLGIGIAAPAGVAAPVGAGALMPLPAPPPPVLQWEVRDGASYRPAEVVSDETAGLTRSGVVELRLPPRWRTGRPAGLDGDAALRWLRLRISHGQYRSAPVLSFIRLNMVRAVAANSLYDEVLEPLAGSGGRGWRLARTPVLLGTLELVVDEGGLADAGGQPGAAEVRWREVADLADSTPEQRHFVLDPINGIVTFGNGLHGRPVPPGFRHVRARRYQVGGGAGAVAAGAVAMLLSAAPFVTGASNPLPASGGADRETQAAAVRRGPQEIRARGRAVTVADYALLAACAPGAQVARAHAVAGLHPAFPGAPIGGVVCVIVVPPERGGGAPIPGQQDLRAVAEYLAAAVAPAGIEVVAAAPRYHRVRVELGLVLEGSANAAETIGRVSAALDRYLHPLRGGEDGQGWPFGGKLVYSALLRRSVGVAGVAAVERLTLVVDGARIPACTDHAISAEGLLWPELHRIVIRQRRAP